MDKERLVKRLMATFLEELQEHTRAIERDLLALEKNADASSRADRFSALFRSAHSLKGAARSVQAHSIEAACHHLEEIFAGGRDGSIAFDEALFQLLFAAADAIREAGRQLRESGESGTPIALILPQLSSAAARAQAQRTSAPDTPIHEPRSSTHSPTDHDVVRVRADTLDAMLMRSGELLIARRRAASRARDIPVLQDTARHARSDWRSLVGMARRLISTNSEHDQRAINATAIASSLIERSSATLRRGDQALRHLEKELQRLERHFAEDQRILERVAEPLDAEIRRARMLPFAGACEGLSRVVRDLTSGTDKRVELTVTGSDIELDRAILDGLRDPLLHLVRNAVDHGIEPLAERRKAKKSDIGRITVGAELRGGHVEITVADDGRGLDIALIREALRKRGMPEPADDQDIARSILLPGVSTASTVTRVSGRGIGLDVVKNNVDAMRGAIDVSFAPGRGTRISLLLPLTLSTIRAVLVGAGEQVFAFDTTNVQRLLRIDREDLRSVEGRDVLLIDDDPVCVVDLSSALKLPRSGTTANIRKLSIVLLAAAGCRAAVLVDQLISEQEIVVRNLGPRFRRMVDFSGATIMPNGQVVLIANAAALIRRSLKSSPSGTSQRETVAPQGARRRLLVVDDSVTTRMLEKNILEFAGYDVLLAADGVEALRLLQEHGADLVVTDIDMPRMDGFTLTETIRASVRFRDLPVILVTAQETEKDKVRGLQAGANAYIVKSAFDQTNLLETIAKAL